MKKVYYIPSITLALVIAVFGFWEKHYWCACIEAIPNIEYGTIEIKDKINDYVKDNNILPMPHDLWRSTMIMWFDIFDGSKWVYDKEWYYYSVNSDRTQYKLVSYFTFVVGKKFLWFTYSSERKRTIHTSEEVSIDSQRH